MTSREDSRHLQQGDSDEEQFGVVGVTAYRSSSDRVVFVENGNPEGWLSTDTTCDCRR